MIVAPGSAVEADHVTTCEGPQTLGPNGLMTGADGAACALAAKASVATTAPARAPRRRNMGGAPWSGRLGGAANLARGGPRRQYRFGLGAVSGTPAGALCSDAFDHATPAQPGQPHRP